MIFFIFFYDVMRGSNLLVNIQMRGMIKEEEKRNRSPSVLISEGGEKRGSRYMNVKRGGKERIERHNRTRGSWRAEEGDLIQKGSLLLKEREKKSKRKAPSRLLDAVSNPISVWPGSAARLPGTGSQWR